MMSKPVPRPRCPRSPRPDDVAQGAVVHVDNAAPLDCTRVDAQPAVVVQVKVNHGGKQVVCCGTAECRSV